MATCKSCGSTIGSSAWKCPQCGSEAASASMIVGKLGVIGVVVAVLVFVVAIFS